MASGDDREAGVGGERGGTPADLWAPVWVLVPPDQQHRDGNLSQLRLREEVLRESWIRGP